MKKLFTLTVFLIMKMTTSFSQCTNVVSHLIGTSTINGVVVTVTSTGCVDSNTIYCNNTLPYFIGFTYLGALNCNGSYNFAFSPPVDSITLNFSGISQNNVHKEIVKIFKNGFHYSIPSAGSLNGCDSMASLTLSGDITGCLSCLPIGSGSGWKGTTILGPISSLSVLDSVAAGTPQGVIFSLFIGNAFRQENGILENKIINKSNYELFPNPFVEQTVLKFQNIKSKTTFAIFNIFGQSVRTISNITNDQLIIDRKELANGIYYFILQTDNKIIASGKLVAE